LQLTGVRRVGEGDGDLGFVQEIENVGGAAADPTQLGDTEGGALGTGESDGGLKLRPVG
jgi:hypothetical protein